MAELLITTQDGNVLLEINLDGRDKLTIGCSPKCDIRLTGPQVSRHHALLVVECGRWLMIDLSANHGIWFQDKQQQIIEIIADQSIRIGKAILHFSNVLEKQIKLPTDQIYQNMQQVSTRSEYLEKLRSSGNFKVITLAVA